MAAPRGSIGEDTKSAVLPYKRSQRPSWSCTECARRKIRCDKKVPCQSCVKRGRAEHCRLEGSSNELADSSSHKQPAPPEQQSDDGRAVGASSMDFDQRRRLSSVASIQGSIQGDSKPIAENGADIFLQGLTKLQLQLDRIEQRLHQQAKQGKSIEDVKARLTDVEDVISALGEDRANWAAKPLDPASSAKHVRHDGANERIHRDPVEGSASNIKMNATRARLHTADEVPRGADASLLAVQPQERNAELASTDAATTLEFLTLGKDRRRDVEFDASSSDSEAETSLQRRPIFPGATGPMSIIESSTLLPTAHAEGAHAENGHDGRSRMLKHLRRGLPPRVVYRIDSLLRSHPDELPPANLLARPAAKPLTDGIKAVTLSPAAFRRIVAVAKEIGAWQHCCVHFPTFEREVEAFMAITMPEKSNADDRDYEGYRAIDPAWLSLFYVICSIAIHQMSEEESAYCGLGAETERTQFASMLLHAAMDSLSLADYLVKPVVRQLPFCVSQDITSAEVIC